MIPREYRELVRSLPGKILVERDAVQKYSAGGLIVLSGSYLDHTKTATGVVYDIHEVDRARLPYKVGDRLLLSTSGGTQIIFGLGSLQDEVELWMFSTAAARCILPPDLVAEKIEEHVMRNERERLAIGATTDDDKFVEGDPEGLR